MAGLFIDAAGHEVPPTTGVTDFTAAATGTTAAGTFTPIAAGAGAGSSTALIAGTAPNDRRGRFTLTGAGTPAAGIIAHVTFAKPYAVLPAAVLVTITNRTDTLVVPGVGVTNVTTAGFDIVGPAILVKSYDVSYVVVP